MNPKILTALVFFISVFLISFKSRAQAFNQQDSLALVDLYNSTDGPQWNNHENWLTPKPVTSWAGVGCFGDRVTELNFMYFHLSGSLPETIGNLTELKKLVITDGPLGGSFPATFGNLVNLEELFIGGTNLSGAIPQSLGSLVNLTRLSLASNKLTGAIPSSIGNLTKLNFLNLTDNQFTGSIPASIGNLVNLSTLYLYNTSITGSIPSSFGNLTSLTYANLSYNQLTGEIPSSIGNLTNLLSLSMPGNMLSGSVPGSLSNLTNLTELLLDDNQLTGFIPPSLSKLTKLRRLSLSGNKLTGTIPSSLGDLKSLGDLNLSFNQLTGVIPASFNQLKGLNVLLLENNKLTGPIPPLQNLGADHVFLGDSMNISHNKFTFNGIENLSIYLVVTFAPQDTLFPIHLSNNTLSVSAGGLPADNIYYWYKNGVLVGGKKADSTFNTQGAGAYNAVVKNKAFGGAFSLYSDTLTIPGDSLVMPAKPASLTASYEYTDNTGWTHYYYNNNTPANATDDILLLSLKRNGQDIGSIGDGVFSVKVVATSGAGSNTGVKLTNPLITNPTGYWVMNRYWQVTPTHEPLANIGVRFYYNNQDLADVNGSYPTHNLNHENLIFYKSIGGSPDPSGNLAGATGIISILHSNHASDTTWTYHKLSDSTHYGEYSVASFSGGGGGGTGNNKALPVKLLNFNAERIKTGVHLSWLSLQEINTGSYIVERSFDGLSFTGIGTVKAAGNISTEHAYSYIDANTPVLVTKMLYYRLKIADKDGHYSYSKILSLQRANSSTLLVYPNPASNYCTIEFTAATAKNYTIEVNTPDGRVLRQVHLTVATGQNKQAISLHGLPTGTYVITIRNGDNVQALKLLKQ